MYKFSTYYIHQHPVLINHKTDNGVSRENNVIFACKKPYLIRNILADD